jgi:hypothetical protein
MSKFQCTITSTEPSAVALPFRFGLPRPTGKSPRTLQTALVSSSGWFTIFLSSAMAMIIVVLHLGRGGPIWGL